MMMHFDILNNYASSCKTVFFHFLTEKNAAVLNKEIPLPWYNNLSFSTVKNS